MTLHFIALALHHLDHGFLFDALSTPIRITIIERLDLCPAALPGAALIINELLKRVTVDEE